MRQTIISMLEGLLYLVLIASVGLGFYAGGVSVGAMMSPIFPQFNVIGGIAGALVGLLLGVITTGVLFVLLDIRDSVSELRAQVQVDQDSD